MRLVSIAEVSPRYRHVFVSPHFDDVALSIGGLALHAARSGEPCLVVAVCTAAPADTLTGFAAGQHDSWGGGPDPWLARENEETSAMAALGADHLWLGHPDAIYRGDQYLSDEDLFGRVKPADSPLEERLADELVAIWRRCPAATVYLPLALGNHVDHQLCRAAASPLVAAGASVALYEDQPYALLDRTRSGADGVPPTTVPPFEAIEPRLIEFGDLVGAKVAAVELYASQVPWIFRDLGPADAALRGYAALISSVPGGHAERLWRPHTGGNR